MSRIPKTNPISPVGRDFISDEDVHVAEVEETLTDIDQDGDALVDEASAPEEITGRAARTTDPLTALFDGRTDEQLADGFRTGTDDDEDVIPPESDLVPTDAD